MTTRPEKVKLPAKAIEFEDKGFKINNLFSGNSSVEKATINNYFGAAYFAERSRVYNEQIQKFHASRNISEKTDFFRKSEAIRTSLILKAHVALHESWVNSITAIEDRFRMPPPSVPYWNDPRIHNFGNNSFLHAALVPFSLQQIKKYEH